MNSYKGIVKTTGLIGLVQVFKLIFGFAQNKVLAILVGPAGFGIWGLLNSFVVMVSSFSTLGIDQAGVRLIAQVDDKEDGKVDEIIWVFKASIRFFAVLSTVLILCFSKAISTAIFGESGYFFALSIVSLAILFNSLNQGQISILNGLRDIRSLAKSQIFGAIFGAIIAIVFVLLYKEEGIPYFILGTSIVASFFSWFFVKSHKITKNRPRWSKIKITFKELLSVGYGIAYSAILVAIVTYFIQIFLRKEFGLEVVGIYNASFTISNIYIGVILSAMGVDLMPRLSKIIHIKTQVNKLVNEQIELGLLVSSIGIVGVIICAPYILKILYSSEFTSGLNIIRWQILGVYLRVLSFPLGYILIIKKKTTQFILVQTLMWGGNYFFLILFTKIWGYESLGMNYFAAYILYILVLFYFNRKEIKISSLSKSIFLISIGFIALAWVISYYLTDWTYINLSVVLISLNLFWIIYFLKEKMNINLLNLGFLKR